MRSNYDGSAWGYLVSLEAWTACAGSRQKKLDLQSVRMKTRMGQDHSSDNLRWGRTVQAE